MSAESAGGVRTPFNPASGRPTGTVILTPVVRRIERWARELCAGGNGVPQAVLLVGGPGNGKSDIVEYFVTKLDEFAGANGELVKAAGTAFSGLSPRRVELDLATFGVPGKDRIEIVQDASGAAADGATTHPSELLIQDLRRLINGSSGTIFLCCVNRGIVASALARSSERGDVEIATLLEDIASSVSVIEVDHPCWPLQSDQRFAVWPMDVESLVTDTGDKSPLLEIVDFAVAPERWLPEESCAAGAMCPFHTNRRLLARPEHQKGLQDVLSLGELASGRRRTFRDLLALVSNLLVGQDASYRVSGRPVSPCEWAADKARLASDAETPEARTRALMELVQKLYPLVLFSRWPRLQREQAIFRSIGGAAKNKLDNIQAFLRFFSRYRAPTSTAVAKSLAEELGPLLDPVEAPSGAILGTGLTVEQVEEAASYSIAQVRDVTKAHLEPLEIVLLDRLVEAEQALTQESLRKTDLQKFEVLRAMLKIFAARFVKRSLGARIGAVKDRDLLKAYAGVIAAPAQLFSAAKLFEKILNDAQGFHASLLTTFGQPSPSRERDVRLHISKIDVSHVPAANSDKYPTNPIPRFKVGVDTISVTYPLYRALREVESGIDAASLDSEVLSLLDGIRARLAGSVVRDEDRLRNGARISFGDLKGAVSFDYDLHPQRVD
ncbi:hypothetical protein JQ636_12340 [Bradyrhizobium japonicum]|uniref:hypothetical protein n=1 Tax=Bradyrhizobium japonicum TaxID=375 RepID=UPI001BA87BC4|nr:hypothetical protein [Bradyrhizobium japonicum]MBR0804330.1 hypothetical protein [Bradyrhizobium japonicum]